MRAMVVYLMTCVQNYLTGLVKSHLVLAEYVERLRED